jgi:hypothetical protein
MLFSSTEENVILNKIKIKQHLVSRQIFKQNKFKMIAYIKIDLISKEVRANLIESYKFQNYKIKPFLKLI